MSDGVTGFTSMERRLRTEIHQAMTPLEADCKRAELAAYRGRLGHIDEAYEALAALRQKNERQPSIALSAWIHLAHGIVGYFDNYGVSNTDGVQRAYALCLASGLHEIRSICASWLAQWAYSKLDMLRLAAHVREVLKDAGAQNHSARSRANLVGAQALHLAGRSDLAQAWYSRSKAHAVADGDEATINALMHNMAWLRMLSVRQAVLTGKDDQGMGRHVLMSAESNASFGALVGDESWQELEPILRAQISSLQGNAAVALSLYKEHLDAATKMSRLHANLLADKAWCLSQMGDGDEARRCAELAVRYLTDETQIDDRAATHSRLAQMFNELGDTATAKTHATLAEQCWIGHASLQRKAIELLSQINEDFFRN